MRKCIFLKLLRFFALLPFAFTAAVLFIFGAYVLDLICETARVFAACSREFGLAFVECVQAVKYAWREVWK